jgi:hypothetical protein
VTTAIVVVTALALMLWWRWTRGLDRERLLRRALGRISHCSVTCDACRDTSRRSLGLSPLYRSTKDDRRREQAERVRWN